MEFSFWVFAVLFIIALLYIFWDVNYFIRIAFTIGWGRLFQKKINLGDTSTIYGLCTTNDVDIFFRHMNNARYVRELDFARFHFYDRSGLYHEIMKVKGHALQSASFVRYRRTIPIFTPYKVTTKLIYYTDKVMFLEQQFITLNDGFVRAVVISKQNIIGMDVPTVVNKMMGKDSEYKPVMPTELQHLTNCIEESSARLRKKD